MVLLGSNRGLKHLFDPSKSPPSSHLARLTADFQPSMVHAVLGSIVGKKKIHEGVLGVKLW